MIRTKKENSIEAAYFARQGLGLVLTDEEKIKLKQFLNQIDDPIEVYVIPDNGDDNNDGLSNNNAMKTLSSAFKKYQNYNKITFHVFGQIHPNIQDIGDIELINKDIEIKSGARGLYIKGKFNLINSRLIIEGPTPLGYQLQIESTVPGNSIFHLDRNSILKLYCIGIDCSQNGAIPIMARSSKIYVRSSTITTKEDPDAEGGGLIVDAIWAEDLCEIALQESLINGPINTDNSCTIIK